MPKMISGRSFRDVPAPRPRTSRKQKIKQEEYDSYLVILETTDVGDLELDEGDNARAVKMSLHRAAIRNGLELEVWDAAGHVYFRKARGLSRTGNRMRSLQEIERAQQNGQESTFFKE